MRLHQSVRFGLLMLSFACNALAQNPMEEDLSLSYGDEEFISIATGQKQLISKAPAVATVITRQDIDVMGASSLDEVLESVPGLHVSLSSIRFTPVYQIRGIATDINSQVLMLVNGVPITQLYFGDRGVRSSLPVSDIARVEVIRGPGSAVYGADAFAGVINVITKSADSKAFEAGARFASFNTQMGWFAYSDSLGSLQYRFSLDFQQTDGSEERIIASDAQSFFDSVFNTNASLAPGSVDTRSERIDSRLEVRGENWVGRFWNWRQKDLGLGPGIAMALDPKGKTEVDNYMLDLSYDKEISNDWGLSAKLALLDLEFTNKFIIFPPGTTLPIGPDGNIGVGNVVLFPDGYLGNPNVFEEHLKSDIIAYYSGLENHSFRIATGFSYGELEASETKNFGPGVIDGTEGVVDGALTDVTSTPFIFMEDQDREVYYVSFQDEWQYAPDWTLTAGIRYDSYSDFGSTINPRLALVWNAKHNLTTKFMYGRAFRAPSFAELFAINNPVVLGNPSLDPEIIDTIEAAIDYRPELDVRVGINLFAYNIEDLILFVPDPGGSSATAQNIGGQKGRGLEVEFEWKVSKTSSLTGHVAYQKSKDKPSGADSANAPELQTYLNYILRLTEKWSMSAQANFVSNRQRANGDPRPEIDDYVTLDISARRNSFDGRWSVALGIRNALDEDRFEPSPVNLDFPGGAAVPGDFPLEERNYYVEASYQY